MISAAGSLTGENDDKWISAEILTDTPGCCRKKPGGLNQARYNPLPHEHMPRNDGILEGWNAGYSGIGCISINMVQIRV